MLVRIAWLACLLGACGGGGTGDDDVDCGFQSDRYLPYQVGFHWEYRVSDPVTGLVETKSQWIEPEMTFPGDGQPALVQVTDKSPGITRSYTRVMGDAVIRLQQEDVSALGVVQRTTVYEPYAIRIDEAAERIAEGATFQESFTEIEYDAAMVEVRRQVSTENWEVISTAEECTAPIGTLTCIHLRRVRMGLLTTQKDYWFAPGVGKVREEGGQVEQLVSCMVQ